MKGWLDKYEKGGSLPVKSKVVRGDNIHSHYDPTSDTIFMDNSDPDEVLNHERFHAFQRSMGKLQIPEFYDGPIRKPSIVNEEDKKSAYYNRRSVDGDILYNAFIESNPTFQFVPPDVVYDRVVEPDMYNFPWTAEGEAEYFEKTGQLPEGYRRGGKVNNKYPYGGKVDNTGRKPVPVIPQQYWPAGYPRVNMPGPSQVYQTPQKQIDDYNKPLNKAARNQTFNKWADNVFFPAMDIYGALEMGMSPSKLMKPKVSQTNTGVSDMGMYRQVGNKQYYSLDGFAPELDDIDNAVPVQYAPVRHAPIVDHRTVMQGMTQTPEMIAPYVGPQMRIDPRYFGLNKYGGFINKYL